jgi:exodeoxyribonuclease V alpha subunit
MDERPHPWRADPGAVSEDLGPFVDRGIEKHLGSGMIRGIGPDYAMRMARQFGKEVFDIIEANPERLREVEGTGPIMSWNPHRLARDTRGIGFRTANVIAENLESIS